MSDYFKLWFEYGADEYADFVLDKPLYEHFGHRAPFFTGKRMKDTFPPTTVSLRSRPKAPDCIGVGSLDLVSERLRDFLIEQKVNAEFLEVEVIQKGKCTESRYYEMNALDVIACMDREQSVYEESVLESGYRRIIQVDRLYVKEETIGSSRLFVMKEYLMLLTHSDLVDALRTQNFTGLKFKPLPQGPF